MATHEVAGMDRVCACCALRWPKAARLPLISWLGVLCGCHLVAGSGASSRSPPDPHRSRPGGKKQCWEGKTHWLLSGVVNGPDVNDRTWTARRPDCGQIGDGS